MKMYVGNLSREASEEEVKDLFAAYGNVGNVKIIKDLFSGESKGFGFVEMAGAAEAQKAMDELNTKEFKGRKLVVNEARPQTDRRGGSSNRGGGSGFNSRGGGNSSFGGGNRRNW